MKSKLSWMKIMLFVLLLSFLNISRVSADSSGYTFTNATKRTTSTFSKYSPKFQISGDKIYYAWEESRHIWTATMNTDGTAWSAVQRTTNVNSIYDINFQIVGSTIFYVWNESDGSKIQIWTSTMNTDGTGWSAVQRTNTAFGKYAPQLQVVGSKVYYVWQEEDGARNQIWTGEMNVDGTGWSATKRTSSATDKRSPQMQIADSKIYYVFSESGGTNPNFFYRIWTAQMNIDGTGWSATQRINTTINNTFVPKMIVNESKIYYFWGQNDGSNYHVWTATMNTDDTGWTAVDRRTSGYSIVPFDIKIAGLKIYYIWREGDGSYNQIWTGDMNIDGTGWSATKRTTSVVSKNSISMDIVDYKIYYLWHETDGSYIQIWTADGNYFETQDESATVTASVPSSLSFTIAGVSSGAACANSGGNASVTSTASGIPFGVYSGAQTKIACQTLTVSTNAESGYIVSVQQNRDLTNAGANTMGKFTGTYAVPAVWTSPISPNKSFFGFTTDDTDLTNFQSEKYSQLAANNTPYTIIQETTSVADEVNIISYQLEVNNLQEAGIYSNTLMYIVTARF